ncbi:hypothetical protein F4818DRAFT_453695 [Hypoxylon cercidicola]|nr:hypothetical protein F4818DRAFT_453695 [Hypoxylon cercidicola]
MDDVVTAEATQEAYLSDDSLDDLPDYEELYPDDDRTGEEFINNTPDDPVAYARVLEIAAERVAARRAAAEGRLALPGKHEADTKKPDSAAAGKQLTDEMNLDDLSDYESDMDHYAAADNTKQEGSAREENRGDVLDDESSMENADMQASDPKSPNAAQTFPTGLNTPPRYTGNFQWGQGSTPVFPDMFNAERITMNKVFLGSIAMRKVVMKDILFEGTSIADAVVVFNALETAIETAVIEEAVIEKVIINAGAVVLEGSVFKNATIGKLYNGMITMNLVAAKEMAVETVVLTNYRPDQEPCLGPDLPWYSPKNGESSHRGNSHESSSSSSPSPASPGKRKATTTEDPMTPPKKRSRSFNSS